MKCRNCSRCALYLPAGFTSRERTYCTERGEFRKKCKHGKKGRPMRGQLDIYVTIAGEAAVRGSDW